MSKVRATYWNPVVPLCLLVYFIGRAWSAGLTPFRGFALLTMVVWLGLAVYDRAAGGRFTRWLYADED